MAAEIQVPGETMKKRQFIGSFATEEDLLGAVWAAREQGFRIIDVFSPCAVHGLDEAMGLRPSRLSWICLILGLLGTAFALSTQPWAWACSWPLNVGGKPWNSLPAFVPVTFEVRVLFAGLGVVLALFLRCRLFPGKSAVPLYQGATDNLFVLVLENPPNTPQTRDAQQLFHDFSAVHSEERGF